MSWALAIGSAVLLAFLFPPYSFPLFAPIALVPLLLMTASESSWRRRFLIGEVAGTIYWLLHCYWVYFVLAHHGGLEGALGYFSLFLFAALKGLHMAAFATLAGWLIESRWAVLAIPALWTGLERTHGELGFQWLLLGNAGIDSELSLRLAPLVGVYGISFFFAAISAALALGLRSKLQVAPGFSPVSYAAIAVTLMLARFLLPPISEPAPPIEQAAAVQPNVPQDARWDDASLVRLIHRVFQSSLATANDASQPKPALILWPESPAPFFFQSDPLFTDEARRLARSTRTHFFFGAVAYTERQEQLNAALMLNPSGDEIGRYAKMYLVPFGEFVPPVFFWIEKITKEAGDSVPGKDIAVPRVNGHGVGGFICYESAFPELVRRFADQGGEVLVNLTNDGYFGRTAARDQHLLLARMRAVENQRWLLRPTNDGFTVSIDPAGRIRQRLNPFEQTAGRLPFSWISTKTPYTKYGDWFPFACLLLAIGHVLTGAGVRSRK